MSIDTNWYVITGGPSSGKTKTIEYLSFLGYPIIPEAARVLIDVEKSKGKTTKEIRSDEFEFQRKALQMKIEVEDRIPPEQITFFDRGIPDSIAYYQICGEDPTPVIKASQKRKYIKVFLLEQLQLEKDYARTEDDETVKKLNRLLRESYLNLGYEIVDIPVMSIEKRVQKILSEID